MCLARFRCFAWMLALVLLAVLATPALASALVVVGGSAPSAVHVHAGGSVHDHGTAPAAHGSRAAAVGAQPAPAPLHCPDCMTVAECAASCLGVGVLPAAVSVPARGMARAWLPARLAQPSGTTPPGDTDPPRPVPVR